MKRILAVLDGTDREFGATVALSIHGLIIASAITYALSTMPSLPPEVHVWLGRFEALCVIVFMGEYFLRLYAAPKRLHYALSFWGIIDLIAWLPSILLVSGATVAVRLVRLLQVFRVLKIMRYSHALRRLGRAFHESRDELAVFFFVAFFLLYLASVGIYFFEYRVQPDVFSSIPASLWWAVVTLTTVGYGDVVPVTAGGRIFTTLVLFLGMGVFAVPAGIITSALISPDIEQIETTLEEIEEVEEANQPAGGKPLPQGRTK
ncbi:MAG: ion transporter [Marinibacterium sp.]